MGLISPPSSNNENPVFVYEWKAWTNCLFQHICKQAIKIEAKIRQSNSDIIKKITANTGYFLFHINLTKTDSFFKNKEELIQLLKSKGITPLNAEINDTSKKYLQSVCEQTGLNVTRATVTGDQDELLIIKTNLNYGGRPEKRLMRSDSRRLNIGSDNYDSEIVYPVMERKKIKAEVWNDDNLIIEKYIANKQNHIYRIYKLLNKVVISEAVEDNLIKKMITVVERNNFYFDLNDAKTFSGNDVKFNDLLAVVIPLYNTLKIDFAAVDVVRSDDNKYYVIDVNLTPNWNRKDLTEILDFLAKGLRLKNEMI